jgi:hypothetical protein
MKKLRSLTTIELLKLAEILEDLETSTLYSTGLIKISGGFASANLNNYENDFIDINLKFGCQSDVSDYVAEEDYRLNRKTFEIIN